MLKNGEKKTILETKSLNMHFGGLVVTDNLSFTVKEGEITSVIGPNGAGKTTLFNLISGYLTPSSGEIIYLGKNIVGKRPYQVCKLGIGRTFQIVKPFGTRTVLYNVMVGAFNRTSSTREAREISEEAIEELGLGKKRDVVAKNLTIADRKRLELAKALVTGPKLLLLDEILAGLTPSEVKEAIVLVRNILDKGITILMIEHVMQAVMALSDKVVVINYGEKIAEGTPVEISSNEEVLTAYLGEDYVAIKN
jgi:branched-chain amino acid transport system ATP-binding protein